MSALEAQHTRELPMELPAPRLSMAAGNHSENTTHDASSDWRVWGRGEEGGTVPSPPPAARTTSLWPGASLGSGTVSGLRHGAFTCPAMSTNVTILGPPSTLASPREYTPGCIIWEGDIILAKNIQAK